MREALILLVGLALAAAVAVPSLAESPPDAFVKQFNLPRDPESVLGEVLSRSEFREDAIGSLVDRFLARVKELILSALKWLFERFPSMEPIKTRGDVFGTIGRALLMGVAFTTLILLGWNLVKLIRGRRRRLDLSDTLLPLEDEEFQTSQQLRSLAQREAESGNFSRALVVVFRFVVARLDEKGLLAYHPGKTNREILQSLQSAGTIRDCLAEMIPVFNRVRYGNFPCTGDDYERFLALALRATEGA
jgi:hypothetical protein